jgi:hypothetical protein
VHHVRPYHLFPEAVSDAFDVQVATAANRQQYADAVVVKKQAVIDAQTEVDLAVSADAEALDRLTKASQDLRLEKDALLATVEQAWPTLPIATE